MKFNDSNIKGPDPSYVGAMGVVVTGGSAEDRLAVKSVIFNALEGARFRTVDYIEEDIPYSFNADTPYALVEPVPETQSLLAACEELNPLLYYTSITLESAPSLLEGSVHPEEIRRGWKGDPDAAANNKAWERAQRDAVLDDTIDAINEAIAEQSASSPKKIVIEGTMTIKF